MGFVSGIQAKGTREMTETYAPTETLALACGHVVTVLARDADKPYAACSQGPCNGLTMVTRRGVQLAEELRAALQGAARGRHAEAPAPEPEPEPAAPAMGPCQHLADHPGVTGDCDQPLHWNPPGTGVWGLLAMRASLTRQMVSSEEAAEEESGKGQPSMAAFYRGQRSAYLWARAYVDSTITGLVQHNGPTGA